MQKLLTRIKDFYRDLLRPVRNKFLQIYLHKPVIVYLNTPGCEDGGIYVVDDYSGLDNMLKLVPDSDEDSMFEVPILVKPYHVQVYSLDKKQFLALSLLNIMAKIGGRV